MARTPRRRLPNVLAPINPMDLLGAPELATLAVLGHVLHVVRLALLAQHPNLLGDEHRLVQHRGDPVSALAERLLDRAHDLGHLLDCYRQAVANADDTPDAELPF